MQQNCTHFGDVEMMCSRHQVHSALGLQAVVGTEVDSNITTTILRQGPYILQPFALISDYDKVCSPFALISITTRSIYSM